MHYARFTASVDITLMSNVSSPCSSPRAAAGAVVRAALLCMLLLGPLIAGPCFPDTAAPRKSLLEQLPQDWLDDQGRDINLAEFRGRRIYFTMAYATCRRVCPMTMAHLQELQSEIEASGQSAEFVIIGYDPAVDDPQAWHQYRRSRGLLRDNWHFLTGTPTTAEQLAHRLGFPFWKYDRHVMHEYRIVIVDEQGKLAQVRQGEK
jgi:protein SCO1/2